MQATNNDTPPEPEVRPEPTDEAIAAAIEPESEDDAEAADPSVEGESSGAIDEAPVYTQSDLAAAVAKAVAEQDDRRLRVLAEYDNFRRRTARERDQWLADALGGFVKDLLPVIDSLDKAAETGADDAAALSEGLAAIRSQLGLVLDKHGIATHDPVGEPFDPRLHDALTRQPSADHEEGTVLTVFEKGYTIRERLVRAARVVVAAKPPKE